jgi:hypothetical protein
MQEIVDFCHGVVGNFTHPDSRFAIVAFDATAQVSFSLFFVLSFSWGVSAKMEREVVHALSSCCLHSSLFSSFW